MSTVTLDSDGDGVPETQLEYEYDDSGIRVAQTKTTDGNADGDFVDPEDTSERTDYLVDYQNDTGYAQVLEERVDGQLSKTYTLGLDVLAQALALSELHHFLYDGHGSTRGLVDATGQPLTGQIYRYDAYGNPIGFDPSTAATTLLYSGEQLDQLTGLQYLRARYYDLATGRFSRVDPFFGSLKDPQSLHRYLYTHGDPLNACDPTGQSPLVSVGMSIAIGAVVVNMVATVALGVKNKLTPLQIAYNVGVNLAFFGLMAVAIVGSGPIAIGAGLIVVGLSLYGLYELYHQWPKLDGIDRTLVMTQIVTYLAFGGGLRASGHGVGQARIPRGAPALKSGQEGYLSRAVVDQYKADMLDGNWRYSAPEGRIALFTDNTGRILVSEGNHRMAAALEIFRESGDAKPIHNLLRNAVRYPVENLSDQGQVYPFPYVEGSGPGSRMPPMPLIPPDENVPN